MIPTLVTALILMLGAVRRADVYAAFTGGAKEGLQTALHTAPYLCAALFMTAALRGSGLMEAAGDVLQPLLARIGVPEELLPFLLMRPVSGSGSLSVMGEIMASCGADSRPARMAAAMMGSSETLLYVVPLYLGAVKMRSSRYVMWIALIAMGVGMTVAGALV